MKMKRHTLLEDKRHRACERVKNENEEQIHTQLKEEWWRVKNENQKQTRVVRILDTEHVSKSKMTRKSKDTRG